MPTGNQGSSSYYPVRVPMRSYRQCMAWVGRVGLQQSAVQCPWADMSVIQLPMALCGNFRNRSGRLLAVLVVRGRKAEVQAILKKKKKVRNAPFQSNMALSVGVPSL